MDSVPVHDWSQGGRTLSIMEKIKTGLRSWLNIQTAAKYSINIMEMADFELSAIMNRIWYRGDSNELDQLYAQCNSYADKYKFWASHSSPGMEIRKLHIGIPHLIVRILGSIVLADMNDFAAVNEVYATFFEKDCPARSCVEVARLPKDVKIEIEAIAIKK